MPISSNAWPAGAPEVTSFLPSRLATRVAGAPVASPGTVMPAARVTSMLADAALPANIVAAAVAASAVPMAAAARRLVLLVMVIILPWGVSLIWNPVVQRVSTEDRGDGRGRDAQQARGETSS